MKLNYNPYVVPEHFFEKNCDEAILKYKNRSRKIRRGIAAIAVVAVLVAIPLFLNQYGHNPVEEMEVVSNNLAEMYEYDIFLQVNFNN